MTRTNKQKLDENVNINFVQSKEIAYWANKYNVSIDRFQQMFSEAGYSISALLRSGMLNKKIAG
jgi:hypothetical protein